MQVLETSLLRTTDCGVPHMYMENAIQDEDYLDVIETRLLYREGGVLYVGDQAAC